MRALWVLRTSLTSPQRIAALVRQARDNGFNTLFVQVRGRGDAYYRDGLERSTRSSASSLARRFQDWGTWLADGVIDAVAFPDRRTTAGHGSR